MARTVTELTAFLQERMHPATAFEQYVMHQQVKQAQNNGEKRKNAFLKESPKKKLKLSPLSIAEAKKTYCCKKNCMTHFSETQIMHFRQEICAQKTEPAKMQFLTILALGLLQQQKNKQHLQYIVNGYQLCYKAISLLYGVSKTKIVSATKNALQHVITVHHNNKIVDRPKVVSTNICAWIKHFISICGDTDPVDGRVYLPVFWQWKDLHALVNADEATGVKCSWRYFKKVVRRNFKNVTLPKNTRLGKCDICVDIIELRTKTARDTEKQEQLRQLQTQHFALVHNERIAYKERVNNAILQPQHCISFILDKMTTTYLPHTTNNTKKSQLQLFKMPFHNLGTICHGRYRRFEWIPHFWGDGPNLTITSLYLQLRHIVC